MFLLLSLLESKKALSTFETSCGLSQELSSSYKSFPESKHVSTALQVIQDSLASPPGSSSNNTEKLNFLVLVPLLFQASLEIRISRYTIRLLESQLLLVIKLWLPF